ncbi:mucin-17-like isoform X2 [Homarus americanus]|uniref:mucin-17-like isoform X2 n=1 Tax=Homarus americanus TaxID=6706 RepID=UPI001C482B77|nr:mucin-17-like isoform X2 [Homarus americanus]
MAAPQQHTLTNTSTIVASPAVLAAASVNTTSSASADTYGSGHHASCDEVYSRLSGVGVGGLNPPTTPAHYPPLPASRRLRPCSLCGTAALRPHTPIVPTSPVGALEQPVVLLHRLEDGLPQGDVNSLRAYGTIRLLPVHSPTHNATSEDDRSDQDGDSNERPVNHAMAHPKHTDDAGKHEDTSSSAHYASWTCSNGEHSLSDEHSVGEVPLGAKLVCTELHNAVAIKSVVNVIENESEADSDEPFIGIRIHSVVSEKDLNIEGIYQQEGHVGDRGESHATPETTSVYPECHPRSPTSPSSHTHSSAAPCLSSCSSSCSIHHHPPSLPPPPLPTTPPPSHPAASTPTTTCCNPSSTNPSLPSTALSTTHTNPSTPEHNPTANHHNPTTTPTSPTISGLSSPTTSHPHPSTSSSPFTPMSLVLSSPVQPLPSSSPSAPLASSHAHTHPPASPSSPSVFSPADSPPSSLPSPVHPSNSVDTTILPPSSPYSPMTRPSSPTSPASLPSRADSPPSPTLSVESPPASPVPSPGLASHEAQHASPHVLTELAKASPLEVGDLPNSQVELWDKRQMECCQVEPPVEAEVEPVGGTVVQTSVCANISPLVDTQDELPADTQVNPSGDTQVESSEDTQTEASLGEGETQVESCESTQVDDVSEPEQGEAEDQQLAREVSSYCERVSEENNPDMGPMKIKFRLRQKVDSHPSLGAEKKECNKENGIPKIVLTLKGNGPNKEYSCSNRLRSEDQSFSGVTVNNKKHKSKKDKKQKLKDKEKTKKSLRGNKHKRQLELFGEDSNDSCDIISNKCNGLNGQNEDHHKSEVDSQKSLHLPLAFPTLGESPERSDDDFLPLPPKRESYAFSVKVERVCKKIKHSSTSDSLDDSLSDSLPDLDPLPAAPEDVEGLASHDKKVEKSVQESKHKVVAEKHQETTTQQDLDLPNTITCVKTSQEDTNTSQHSVENQDEMQEVTESSTCQHASKEIPETSTSQPDLEKMAEKSINQPGTEKTHEKSTLQKSLEKIAKRSISQSGPEKYNRHTSHEKISKKSTTQQGTEKITEKSTSQPGPDPCENTRGSTLRSRRERIVKNTKSDRDSDRCLWVSFGVDGPVPLPTSDMPSLEPILDNGDNAKASKASDGHLDPASSHPTEKSTRDVEKCRRDRNSQVVATRKSQGGKNSEAKLEKSVNAVDCVVEEKDYNERHKRCLSSQSQLNNREVKDSSLGRKHMRVEQTHRKSSIHRTKECDARLRPTDKLGGSRSKRSSRSSTQERKEMVEGSGAKATPAETVAKGDDIASQEHGTNTSINDASKNEKTESLASDGAERDEVAGEETHSHSEELKPPEGNATSLGVTSSSDEPGGSHTNEEQPSSSDNAQKHLESPDKPGAMEGEDDSQYYRPKKIRRMSDTKLSRENVSDNASSVDLQDPRTSWLVVSETDKYLSKERNLSVNENQVCAKSITAPDATPSEAHVMNSPGIGSSASKVTSDTSEVEMDTQEIVPEGVSQRDDLAKTCSSVSQDSSGDRGQKKRKPRSRTYLKQNSKVGSQEDCGDDVSSPLRGEDKEEGTSDKLDSASREDSMSSKEDVQSQETPQKDEKEKKRKTRKEKKKNGSGDSVSKSRALQEAQQRREVLNEEERGRRLAQEIKGFNWLEQKIKNGSLLSPGSSSTPSTPTTPRDPPGLISKTPFTSSLSSDPPTPSSAPPFPSLSRKREEEEPRRCSLSGGIGLRRHLQTAVPPLAPLSRVTAQPKRRLSPTQLPPATPTTPSPLYSPTNVHSMTVQGTINPTVPALFGPAHSKPGKPSGAGEPTDSNKATLYSSTTCNKATLYGVNSDNLEVFIDSVKTTPNYYGSVTSNNTTLSDDTITTPSNYYGSKTLASVQHPAMLSSSGVGSHPSVITTTAPADWAQPEVGYFGLPYYNNPVSSSHVSTDQGVGRQSDSGNNYSKSNTTTVTAAPPQFSHKHTLLRRAFQEMLKSDSESSPELVQKEKSVFKFDDAADLPKTHDEASKITEMLDVSTHVMTATTSKSLDLVDDESSKLYIPKDEISESTILQVETKFTPLKKEIEPPGANDSNEEIAVDITTHESQDTKTREMKIIEKLPAGVLESIKEGGGKFDVKSLKGETKSESDIQGKEEDREMQSSLLLSVLYKELMRTRQEVEELRKVQEQMLTEKGEKKEDNTEETKKEEGLDSSDKKGEKRKCSDDANYKSVLDNKESTLQPEAKKSKISIRSDLLLTDNMITTTSPATTSDSSDLPRDSPSLLPRSSPPLLKTNTQIIPTTKVPLTSPVLPDPGFELSVISLVNSSAPQTSHVLSRTSPGISMTSPGISRTSPGLPRTSPGLPRTSPGLPRTSPGLPRTSPGLPRTSPGLPRTSPGLPRTSPGSIGNSPGVSGTSPGPPRTSPVIMQAMTVPHSNSVSQNSHIVSYTSPAILQSPIMSDSPVLNSNVAMSKMTIGQPTISPGIPRSRPSISSTITAIPISSPTASRTSPVISRTSPVISRVSPAVSRMSPVIARATSIPASKSDSHLAAMSPDKLRTVFGISNSEVEVMPVSVGGKYPLPEPSPQTYLKVLDEFQHLPQESPLLLNAVKGVRRDSLPADVEVLASTGLPHFRHNRIPHEDTRRTRQSQENEVKHIAFAPSDPTDLQQQSLRKQPPPLKSAASLVRRYSDSLDVHQINPLMHRLMYPSTHPNPAVSIHSTNSSTEQQKMASLYSFAQPQCNPTQYPPNAQTGRRNSESSCSERSREYQQAVALSMQHQYQQHLGANTPMMRSLGPDKASIFPIPSPMSTVIRPYKPPSPPVSNRSALEYQSENFYRSNMPFFERLRENIQQSGIPSADRGHAGQKRLQPATGTVEKPPQPQTFAPRVLVRESVPETSSHMPPPSFSTTHFANTNQHLPNVMPNHHGHYPNNMHPSSTIHHLPQTGVLPGNHQVASSVIANTNSNQRNNSGGNSTGEKKQCLNCPQPARFLCSGCKKAWYCSEQCQRDHWRMHSAMCSL